MTFEQLERNFNEIDIDDLVVKAVMMNDAEIIDLNTSQLDEGLFSTGEKTPEYASKEYMEEKRALGKGKGQPNMNFDLTGDFRSGWYIKNINKAFEFNSRDSKTPELVRREGEDIFGLTENNKGEAAQIILPDLQDLTLKALTK